MTNTAQTETVTDWQTAGRRAFERGDRRTPTADPAVLAAIASLPVGAGAADIMRAWSAGWDAANLAAPLDFLPVS